jgi:hypothetical protein
MSKLPTNLVRKPQFDDPFRPTTPRPSASSPVVSIVESVAPTPEASASEHATSSPEESTTGDQVGTALEAASEIPAVGAPVEEQARVEAQGGPESSRRKKTTKSPRAAIPLLPAVGDDAYPFRLTARFTEKQWRLLQTECHRRRMSGQRINVAELLRQLVDEWAQRAG